MAAEGGLAHTHNTSIGLHYMGLKGAGALPASRLLLLPDVDDLLGRLGGVGGNTLLGVGLSCRNHEYLMKGWVLCFSIGGVG